MTTAETPEPAALCADCKEPMTLWSDPIGAGLTRYGYQCVPCLWWKEVRVVVSEVRPAHLYPPEGWTP